MTIKTADNRVRLTILGGFLGSGKTTWLRHQLHAGALKDAWVMVNEAAEISIDDVILIRPHRLSVLAGGCACCAGRQGLIEMLRGLCDRRVGAGEAIDRIVLETSGLADPGAIMEAVRHDPVLVHHIVVADIIVTVDALHGLAQIAGEPLSRGQIEAADRLVVTKLDQAEETNVKRLIATLQMINPGASVMGAVMGVPTDIPDPAGILPELPLSASETAAPLTAHRLDIDADIDWTSFAVWLSALIHARGDDVMRIKGVVRTPAGRLLIQSVRKAVQSPEILPQSEAAEDNALVFIGRGFTANDLCRSLRYFAAAA